MKILLFCNQCIAEKRENIKGYFVNYNDEGIYKEKCIHGHIFYTISLNERFMELFDIAYYALKDGYYRETVASSTAALESFYEFCIKVFLKKSEITENEFNKAWKNIKNQSERQLGAYYFLYLNHMKKNPNMLSERAVSFRNNVIHKGKIPTYNESREYLIEIYNIINQTLFELNKEFKLEIDIVRNNFKAEKQKKIPNEIGKYTITTPKSFISIDKINERPEFGEKEKEIEAIYRIHKKNN